MSSAIRFDHVDVIFGRDIPRALAMLDSGEGRDSIFQKTGTLVAVHDASLGIEPGEILRADGSVRLGQVFAAQLRQRSQHASRGFVLVHDGEGEVDVAKCDAATLRRLRMHRISMVFQQFALMPWRTIRDNVGFGLEVRGASKAETDQIVEEKLKLVRLRAVRR